MRIAITGAGGFVGSHLIRHLAPTHQVAALQHTAALPPIRGLEVVRGGLDANTLRPLLSGCDAAVHCAFAHAPGRYRGGEGDDPRRFWRDNFGGTIAIMEAAQACGVPRVLLLSSRAVFDGVPHTTSITDATPPRPTTHYGLLKTVSEGLAALYEKLTVVSLRPTGVYGIATPVGASKWFDIVRQLKLRELEVAATLSTRRRTEVNAQCLCHAVELLLEAPANRVRNRAFNCSDLAISQSEIMARAAERIGLDAPVPAPTRPATRVMQCDGLRSLGWHPGGLDRLDSYLDALVQHA